MWSHVFKDFQVCDPEPEQVKVHQWSLWLKDQLFKMQQKQSSELRGRSFLMTWWFVFFLPADRWSDPCRPRVSEGQER